MTIVAKRLLTSLTDLEAKTVFALAFGYGPAEELFEHEKHDPFSESHTPSVTISNGVHSIHIHSHGYISVWFMKQESTGFNAYKVLNYLSSIGIDLNMLPEADLNTV